MTRPMPGPPECGCPMAPPRLWTTHYGAVDPVTMIEYNPACPVHGDLQLDKRLTDAECEREWEAFEQDASTALLLHTLGDKRVPAWRFKRFNHGANTWRRFATHPHALEEA